MHYRAADFTFRCAEGPFGYSTRTRPRGAAQAMLDIGAEAGEAAQEWKRRKLFGFQILWELGKRKG